jgi:hypothetical protein
MHPKQQLYNLFMDAYVNLHKDLKKEVWIVTKVEDFALLFLF